MELRVFTEPQQGAAYDDQLAMARAAEDAGFGGFFRSDHFLAMGDRAGLPGPTDAWLTLAGLARDTSRIRLGTLVTSVTFRAPGLLAVQVAQVDQMSGGRVEFGVGAGWFEQEHTAHGVPFPGPRERMDLLEDTLAVATGMWVTPEGTRYSYEGRRLAVRDSPALPKPVQRPYPPVIVGGMGPRRTPALAARYADEFNVAFQPVAAVASQFERVRDACRAQGRDPGELTWSVALTGCVGKDDAEVARRAEAIGRDASRLREEGLAGTPAEVVDRLGRWREQAGVERCYLQLLDLSDLDQVDLVAGEVLPQL
ncbi:LLM class F420-dependent oxidoreductase [Ornithinicoccus halotolerans]|uniref:LLM class F420-dependent oxidoreductase n=1 Tax=Ornithinicoccus halotolerans TaxID=1748220 RepID=UPI001294EDBF|nr:LLM class F420-dependent oxidoreductase [Ornithinicoccus halotolerans]